MSSSETPTFHMHQLWLEARGLNELGKKRGLPLHRVDTGYLVHCALGELFGEKAPKPYAVESGGENGRHVHVLGYAGSGAEALQTNAQVDASPSIYDLCDWDRHASKPMPEAFPEGMALQFELRACPVVRKSSAGEGPDGQTWSEGQELDAFLSRAWENPDKDLSREGVYSNWLERQFDIRGGAEPQSIGMKRFSIERMTRRTHGKSRTATTIQRPDVTLTGTLQVTDSDAFINLLRSGLGRHKSFGYGMLKVRRA